MAWLEIFRWRDRDAFVVDCQADLLSFLPTRFIMPFLPEGSTYMLPRLNPVITFERQRFTLVPQLATTLTVVELGEAVGSILEHEYTVMRAIDFLTTGI